MAIISTACETFTHQALPVITSLGQYSAVAFVLCRAGPEIGETTYVETEWCEHLLNIFDDSQIYWKNIFIVIYTAG